MPKDAADRDATGPAQRVRKLRLGYPRSKLNMLDIWSATHSRSFECELILPRPWCAAAATGHAAARSLGGFPLDRFVTEFAPTDIRANACRSQDHPARTIQRDETP